MMRPIIKVSMKKLSFVIGIVIVTASILLWWLFGHSKKTVIFDSQEYSTNFSMGIDSLGNGLRRIEHVVEEGDTPAEIMHDAGLSYNDVKALVTQSQDVFDFTHVKIGQALRFFFDENRLSKVEYDVNNEEMVVAQKNGENYTVQKIAIPYDHQQITIRGSISDFLYVDAQKAGLPEVTVLELADIFGWDIDFLTDIRIGDQFTVVFDKRFRDGAEASPGRIFAASFVNQGKKHEGFYFEVDGKGGYYSPDGEALERQFLKAPLNFRRITSGFTGARFHPITKRVSAHYQIDYAAASGTPVVASANGTVTSAGYETGWGNIVRVRHNNGYTTHYAHMSGYGKEIKIGTRVSQGQVVGFVGSTGWSTGPHLDYGMKLNGTPINPLTAQLPKGVPLPENLKESFFETKIA